MINPIALKVLNLFPLPNNPGTGAGGLTNNYQRQEDRTFDRDNYDAKVNWNRTSAHQIWGKFSYMNAVVDDLTNYLGPDPNASGDGGFTKVYQATAGQTWTLTPTLLMDMTFGFGRQNQHVLRSGLPGRQLRPRRARDSRHQRSGHRRLRFPGPVRRLPACSTHGFSAVGNRDGWNPIFRDERTYSLATNLTKMKGRHDIRGGYLMNFFYLDHWQPETGNPRGQFDFNGAVDGAQRAARRPTTSTTSSRRSCSGYAAAEQERPERADDRARVAALAVHPRPVDANSEADARPRHALRALSDHAPCRRPRPRSAST